MSIDDSPGRARHYLDIIEYGRHLFAVADDGSLIYPPSQVAEPDYDDLAPVLPFKCPTRSRKPARRAVRASGGGAA